MYSRRKDFIADNLSKSNGFCAPQKRLIAKSYSTTTLSYTFLIGLSKKNAGEFSRDVLILKTQSNKMRQRFFLWLLLGMTLTSAWAQQQNAAVTATPNPFSESASVALRFTGVNLTTWGVNDAYLWAWSLNSAGVAQDAPNNGSWTSSSEAHKLTKNTDGSLSITFIPKDFYGRTNISRIGFLVKAKDGSGDKKPKICF